MFVCVKMVSVRTHIVSVNRFILHTRVHTRHGITRATTHTNTSHGSLKGVSSPLTPSSKSAPRHKWTQQIMSTLFPMVYSFLLRRCYDRPHPSTLPPHTNLARMYANTTPPPAPPPPHCAKSHTDINIFSLSPTGTAVRCISQVAGIDDGDICFLQIEPRACKEGHPKWFKGYIRPAYFAQVERMQAVLCVSARNVFPPRHPSHTTRRIFGALRDTAMARCLIACYGVHVIAGFSQ